MRAGRGGLVLPVSLGRAPPCTARASSGLSWVRSCGFRTSTSPATRLVWTANARRRSQKEIDDIAAEKAAKEAAHGWRSFAAGQDQSAEGDHPGGTRAEGGRARGAAPQAASGGGRALRAERKRQVRARILEKIRSGVASALSDRARKYLEDAGAPVSTDEDLCAAVEEEDRLRAHVRRVRGTRGRGRSRREGGGARAAQAAADAAKEDELFGARAAPPSDGDDATRGDDVGRDGGDRGHRDGADGDRR